MTHFSNKFALVAAVAMSVMLATSMQIASAQDKPAPPPPAAAPAAAPADAPKVPKLKAACGQDIASFCADVKGASESRKCLRTHRTELSPSCTAYFKARRAAAKAKAAGAPPAAPPAQQ